MPMLSEFTTAAMRMAGLGPKEPVVVLNYYRCTNCFGIVGTEAQKHELTCICGGKLVDESACRFTYRVH